jgi:hypothetical protein
MIDATYFKKFLEVEESPERRGERLIYQMKYISPFRKLCTSAEISTMPKSAFQVVGKHEVIRVHLLGVLVDAEQRVVS